mmetsp:Transcript_33045/g.65424  ORF Transcript_33045/g.65424 Transcript_33045/m.65424 type:complete len:281 (+) Transcript_33045:54-896(+)
MVRGRALLQISPATTGARQIFPWIFLSLSLLINALSPSPILYRYSPAVAGNVPRRNRIAAAAGGGDGDGVGTRKEQLLVAVAPTEMGFAELSADTRALVSALADDVVADGPATADMLPPGSAWTLLYASAPDFLGLRGGPFSTLVSIGQQLASDGRGLDVLLEYAPSDAAAGLLGGPLGAVLGGLFPSPAAPPERERLVQTVAFDCRQPGGGALELRLVGTSIRGDRFGGGNLVPAPTLTLPSNLAQGFPFSSCRVLYNDGNLRIDRGGDFLGIYRKVQS